MSKDFRGQNQFPPGIRNNNPGNLRPGDKWQGMTSISAQNFIIFENIAWGLRALGTDISNKVFRGLDTISKIIEVYAPRSENNTDAYISAVSVTTGIGKNEKIVLSKDVLKKLMRAIIKHEVGTEYAGMITDADIDEGIGKMSSTILLKLKSFL
jgi:hypothetical protein